MTATSSTGAVSEALARIEAELAQLWATGDGEAPKVRASTINYVIAASPAEIEHARDAADSVAEARPGRIFLTSLEARTAPWDVVGESSAMCHREGDDVVCYDRVEVKFGAASAARAGSVVAALTLSELPVIFEVGRGAASPLVDALLPRADRVIVDSAHTDVTRIAEMAGHTRAPVADRAYVRGFTWRELVARFFDLERQPALDAITKVTISRTPGSKVEPASLLVGWLAARLGWTFASRTIAKGKQGEIAIELVELERDDLGPGELTGVRIESSLGGAPLYLHTRRVADVRTVEWHMSGAATAEHTFPLGHRDETWVAIKAFESTEGDAIYVDVVRAAAAWRHAP